MHFDTDSQKLKVDHKFCLHVSGRVIVGGGSFVVGFFPSQTAYGCCCYDWIARRKGNISLSRCLLCESRKRVQESHESEMNQVLTVGGG